MKLTEAMRRYLMRAIEARMALSYSKESLPVVLPSVIRVTIDEIERRKWSSVNEALRMAADDAENRAVILNRLIDMVVTLRSLLNGEYGILRSDGMPLSNNEVLGIGSVMARIDAVVDVVHHLAPDWSSEWPSEPGDYWFHGCLYKHCDPHTYLARVSKDSTGKACHYVGSIMLYPARE